MCRPPIDYDHYRARARAERAKAIVGFWRWMSTFLHDAWAGMLAHVSPLPRAQMEVR